MKMFAYFFDPVFDYLSTSLRRTLLLYTFNERASNSSKSQLSCH